MELTITILSLLLIGAWLGYREIGVGFLGIHIRDLISTRVIGATLIAVSSLLCLAALFITNETASRVNNLSITEAYIIMCGTVMTIAIVRSANMYTSAVTALWGALAAVAYNYQWLDTNVLVAMLLSVVAAPLLGTVFFTLFDKAFDRLIVRSDKHLLLKNLHMKRLALVGIVLGGLTLTINFALLAGTIMSSLLGEIDVSWLPHLIVYIVLLSTAMAIPATIVISNENPMAKPMRWALPSLYSMITVMLVGNLGATLLLGMTPVIVSPSQLRECSKMTKGSRNRSLFNLATISLLTPLLAFVLVLLLCSVVRHPVLMLIITSFVIVTCGFIILYSRQRRSHKITKKALNDELTHNSEAGEERNRLDVAAVTSQFNMMTSEIDIKHKELVNLSLYIKQQRQYLEDLSKQLNSMADQNDLEMIKSQLRETSQKLADNMRLTDEMDQFYAHVEEQHKNFVSRLLMRCPNLSEKEKRLAIMLRLGFSSKEISSMMNVEPKSVEVSRYRFRRKLKLDRSINIVEYLQMI